MPALMAMVTDEMNVTSIYAVHLTSLSAENRIDDVQNVGFDIHHAHVTWLDTSIDYAKLVEATTGGFRNQDKKRKFQGGEHPDRNATLGKLHAPAHPLEAPCPHCGRIGHEPAKCWAKIQ